MVSRAKQSESHERDNLFVGRVKSTGTRRKFYKLRAQRRKAVQVAEKKSRSPEGELIEGRATNEIGKSYREIG